MDDLVRVEIAPGRFVKVRRDKADKMRRPGDNKRPRNPTDDFTAIPGVGQATAMQLQAHGIQTFAQLRTTDVGFLPTRAQTAIEEWR
jgi:predicted flap endonuclease-1-like 5' DNA nuclease